MGDDTCDLALAVWARIGGPLLALFSCIGTIVLLDLRILGVAERNQGLLVFAEQLRPLTWIGSGAAVVSGFLLFATEAGDFAVVTPFRLKMVIVALALISALVIEWSVPKWNRAPVMPVTAKVLALISITLWLGAILASRGNCPSYRPGLDRGTHRATTHV